MRTREKKLSDYGISLERAQELLLLARQEQNRDLLRRAAENSCPGLSDSLLKSLTEGIGYWSICSWVYIPATKADFYGYRRKTLAVFNNLLQDAAGKPHKT